MAKDKLEELFEHLFEEAVHESFEGALRLSEISVKLSWESISKKIDEQRRPN